MHAERDIVLPILSVWLSVCLSVQCRYCEFVIKEMDILSHFDILVSVSFCFLTRTAVT